MQVNRHKAYEGKKFRSKEISNTLIAIMDEMNIPEDAIAITGTYKNRSGEAVTKEISLTDLSAIRDFEGQISGISMAYPTDLIKSRNKDNTISFSDYEGAIMLSVSSDNFPAIQNIMDKIEEQLKLTEILEKPQRKTASKLAPFEGNVPIEESAPVLVNRRQEIYKSSSCFLSYRFHARAKSYAPELSRFLTLIDIKVISGVGYERRRVAGKASGRQKSNYDFFIYLITQEDESTWTKDELTSAYDEGVPVIILLEKGVNIGREIIGSHEYVEFDGDHIGDTFIAILEAINFMRDQGAIASNQQSDAPED